MMPQKSSGGGGVGVMGGCWFPLKHPEHLSPHPVCHEQHCVAVGRFSSCGVPEETDEAAAWMVLGSVGGVAMVWDIDEATLNLSYRRNAIQALGG